LLTIRHNIPTTDDVLVVRRRTLRVTSWHRATLSVPVSTVANRVDGVDL